MWLAMHKKKERKAKLVWVFCIKESGKRNKKWAREPENNDCRILFFISIIRAQCRTKKDSDSGRQGSRITQATTKDDSKDFLYITRV